MELFYQIAPLVIGAVLAAIFLIWAYRHNELKRYLRGFFAFVFIGGAILAIPAYILFNKNNEAKAKDCARDYTSTVGHKMNYLGENKNTYEYKQIKECFPSDYYIKNVNDLRIINDTKKVLYGAFQGQTVGCTSSVSYVEKCSASELEKDIAINYGVSIDIKYAYTVYVYYKVTNTLTDYSATVPIICGKVGDEWFVLEDFDENGLLNTLKRLYGSSLSDGNESIINTDNSDNSSSSNYDFSSKIADGYIYDPNQRLSEDDKQKLNEYLTSKYEDTGARMYIVYYDSDDTEEMKTFVHEKLLNSSNSSAMAYSRTASDNSWRVDWRLYDSKTATFEEKYEQIHTAYLSGSSYYDRLINTIDKAYELYGE